MILRYSESFAGQTFDGSSPIDFAHGLPAGQWRLKQLIISTTIRTATYTMPSKLQIDVGLRDMGRHFKNAGTGLADDGYLHFFIPANQCVSLFNTPPEECDFYGSFDCRFVLTDDAATIGQSISISVVAEVVPVK